MTKTIADRLRALSDEERDFATRRSNEWETDWLLNAREGQLPPRDNKWHTWLMVAGRGWGKTRAGAEWVYAKAVNAEEPTHFLFVGKNALTTRSVMFEGESGILNVAQRHGKLEKLDYNRMTRTIKFPNGSTIYAASLDELEDTRGMQVHHAWIDELDGWTMDDLDQVGMVTRLNSTAYSNKTIITTTEVKSKLFKKLMKWVRKYPLHYRLTGSYEA